MKVVFIGYGSIAKKHLNALKTIDPSFQFYAIRSNIIKQPENRDLIENLSSWDEMPNDIDFIVISNPTSLHFNTLKIAVDYDVPIFLEKPPFHSLNNINTLLNKIATHKTKIYCGFTMKFHPLIQWVKENINPKEVIEVHCYCGSYLPDWRKGEDYRTSYSAIKELGGGVHLDLIHEIDYLIWIFGTPLASMGLVRKNSELEIDTYDSATYLLEYESRVINITLNYFRKKSKRTLELVTKDDVILVDLIEGRIINSKNITLYETEISISDMYVNQMKYFLRNRLKEADFEINSLQDSLESLRLCLNVKDKL